jgi:hypothetical protein
MNRLAAVLVIFLFTSSPASSQVTPVAETDAAVLSAVVKDRCLYVSEHNDGKVLILSTQAASIQADYFPEMFDKAAVRSLISRNKGKHKLPRITLCEAFKLVSERKLDAIFAKSWWKGFYHAFPNASGIFRLSLPGYSADGKLALVQVSGSCGGLCGSGFYWVLRYVHGSWIVVKRNPAWVS